MRIKFKGRRGSGIYVSVLAGAAFIYLAVTRFDLPAEKALEFLWICFVLIAAIIVVAAPAALLLQWWSNRKSRDETSPGNEGRK